MVIVAKKTLLKPSLITSLRVTTKAEALLNFNPDYTLFTLGYLPANRNVEALSKLLFHILVTETVDHKRWINIRP